MLAVVRLLLKSLDRGRSLKAHAIVDQWKQNLFPSRELVGSCKRGYWQHSSEEENWKKQGDGHLTFECIKAEEEVQWSLDV